LSGYLLIRKLKETGMSSNNSFTITIQNGICHLSGDLGSDANLAPLHGAPVPLQLNLKNLGDINSIGVRNLCIFLREYKGENFSYIECPPNFLEILNMVPMLLKASGSSGTVESMWVPYACSRCYHEQNLLTKNAEVKVEGENILLKSYDCTACNCDESLEPSMAPNDLLYFILDEG